MSRPYDTARSLRAAHVKAADAALAAAAKMVDAAIGSARLADPAVGVFLDQLDEWKRNADASIDAQYTMSLRGSVPAVGHALDALALARQQHAAAIAEADRAFGDAMAAGEAAKQQAARERYENSAKGQQDARDRAAEERIEREMFDTAMETGMPSVWWSLFQCTTVGGEYKWKKHREHREAFLERYPYWRAALESHQPFVWEETLAQVTGEPVAVRLDAALFPDQRPEWA